jgi:hypothetical protein
VKRFVAKDGLLEAPIVRTTEAEVCLRYARPEKKVLSTPAAKGSTIRPLQECYDFIQRMARAVFQMEQKFPLETEIDGPVISFPRKLSKHSDTFSTAVNPAIGLQNVTKHSYCGLSPPSRYSPYKRSHSSTFLCNA